MKKLLLVFNIIFVSILGYGATFTGNLIGNASSATNLQNLRQLMVTNVYFTYATNQLDVTGGNSFINTSPYTWNGAGFFDSVNTCPAFTNTANQVIFRSAILGTMQWIQASNNFATTGSFSYDLSQPSPIGDWSGIEVLYHKVFSTNSALEYVTFIDGILFTNAPIIYLSPYGNDFTAQRGNPALPFKTVANAYSKYQSGDTLYFGPGTYDASDTILFLTNSTIYAQGAIITNNYAIQPALQFAGTFDWYGGRWVCTQTNITQPPISYIMGATNHCTFDGVTIDSTYGCFQGTLSPNEANPYTFYIRNCDFSGGTFVIELVGPASVNNTNVFAYIENTRINADNNRILWPPTTYGPEVVKGVSSAGVITYVTGCTIIIQSTNAVTSAKAVGLNTLAGTAAASPKIIVSGTTIDLIGPSTAYMAGASNIWVYGHPYDDSRINQVEGYSYGAGFPHYIGVTNGAVNTFTNPANIFYGSFTGNGSGLTNLNPSNINGQPGVSVFVGPSPNYYMIFSNQITHIVRRLDTNGINYPNIQSVSAAYNVTVITNEILSVTGSSIPIKFTTNGFLPGAMLCVMINPNSGSCYATNDSTCAINYGGLSGYQISGATNRAVFIYDGLTNWNP